MAEAEAVEGVSVKTLLTEKVGSGPKSADDMTYEEARAAMEEVLEDDVPGPTLGAFFLANRWKRNTPEELAGFLDLMHEDVVTAPPDASPVDCGANYDGKTDTALFGVASGLAAAAAGTPVAVHSADRVPASEGVAYRQVLEELGVGVDVSPESSAHLVDEVGFGFYDARAFNPKVDDLLPARRETGVRTFVNTVETLANPAAADSHLGSFFHLAFAKKVCRTLERSSQSVDRVVMFQGLEGYDDIRPGYTKVAVWEDDELRDFEVQPEELGLSFERNDLEVEEVAGWSAEATVQALSGDAPDPVADAVALNAALRIYAAGDSAGLEEAVDRAEEVLRDGKAYELLERLQEVSGG